MGYIDAFKTAIFIFPILTFFFTFPFILNQYHKYGSISKMRSLIIYSFILYLLIIYFLVILPLPNIKDVTKSIGYNLVPFSFISDIVKESSFVLTDPSTYLKVLFEPCIYTVVFNILMFVPFGIYLRYYFKCSFKKTVFCSFLLSLFFELTQASGLYFIYPYAYRLFDVDDLIINTFGGLLGYCISGLFIKYLPSREEIDLKAVENGREVSGFKRLTVFFLDMFIFLIFYMFMSMIDNSFLLWYFVYFALIPIINNGKTIGSGFLKVRLVYKNKYSGTILRCIFLPLYYFVLPYLFMELVLFLNDYLNLKTFEIILLDGGMVILILIFYLSNVITILRKKKIFYDNIFKVNYVSLFKDDNVSQ